MSRASASIPKKHVPGGGWPTPVTAELVLGAAISFADVLVSPRTSSLVWLEGRPSEAGRNAIVHYNLGTTSEVIPMKEKPFNARTRVHEYGGASVAFAGDKIVFSDMQGPLYEVESKEDGGWTDPKQVSPKSEVLRYADFSPHPQNSHLLLSVCEDHTNDDPANVVNTIVLLDTTSASLTTIVSGTDFYSAPRWSPSGKKVCYVQWAHPDMPWQGSELWVGTVAYSPEGTGDVAPFFVPGSAKKIAGVAAGVESVSQPRWALDVDEDKLVFLSDRTGYYELYVWTERTGVSLLLSEPSGRDVGGPDWIFGQSTHAPLTATSWISRGKDGSLSLIALESKTSSSIPTPYASIAVLRVVSPTQIVVVATPQKSPEVLALLTISEDGKSVTEEILKVSSFAKVDADFISKGQKITFPTKAAEGESEGQVAHGIFYPPTNKHYAGLEGELPPLVVHCHGGPTSGAPSGLVWAVQYFTSRGFAYADVDYGGSSGYGKGFRARLDRKWGLVDVDDTVACVEYLSRQKMADPKRVAITGGSAGGFTVLAALCASKVFGAGTSLYGISDLLLLAGDTHKFESQYLFGLLGGTPTEVPQVYHDRSPIHSAANITAPLLILQGSLDRVVPPEQATKMAETIKAGGGQAELIVFEGEGHGFRRADSKKRAFEEEVAFYQKTFGIPVTTE